MKAFFKFANVIGGLPRSGGRIHRGVDPSTKTPLWDVPVASRQDVEDAVTSAKSAFPSWSRSSWEHRRHLLLQARDVLLANRTQMAELITKEGGKPIQFANLEVDHAANFLQFNANCPAFEERVIQDDAELKLTMIQKPIGVVAAICPWNYPLVLAMGKIAPALITGNCTIVKPSPFTPYSILKFVELVQPLFPPGVLQALNGDDTLGPQLTTHPGIDKISFTGSTATGKKIAASAAATMKYVTLELGGNSASIVCPDVDPRIVAPQVALGSFFNSGQLCVASKRVYVHEDIYDDFLQVMVDTVKQWKVAPTSGFESDIMLGPIQNEMQYNIVKQFFADSHANGHRFVLGGELDGPRDNYIISPAIVSNPPDDSLVVTGEAFGPIVPVMRWKDEDEVIRRANDTRTGLGGAVWSSDLDRAYSIADRIEAGTVWINGFEKPLPQGHLHGYKESGLGGEWGHEGLSAYCRPQVLHCYKAQVGPAKL
ncbi:aldehyde dehydrogenase [Coniochaeta ligniaria NRRL 30616]|uniref:aldehyde dehydrogenase (NAD(+)) n=1 Tax=Coniochaeta ligniaria NRRL 30616 TaxID=1408157 RepID=A0A1J7IPW0_9PEZI|nr:aldehyde dehydrogenase [Coniochaeta ligniaria NRRL 30616]